ncbi:MAG TPA: hypothetical protein DEQ38_05930 [Elusimicrobia bacterium]|nr:MAG: hypothetical protein A2089_13895 [Elusimicrobia bacterium GWD2_63_28]HCC47640.1 hypothetical protein [Elusimicrobiota bacterium]
MGNNIFSRLAETARNYRLKSAFALLFINLFFLALAGMNDWDPCLLMRAYWWEMVIIWFYAALRVAAVSPAHMGTYLLVSLLITCVPMYVFTYGVFALGQCGGIFGWTVPADVFFQPPVLIGAAALLVSHGVSFYYNTWQRRAEFSGAQANDYAISQLTYPLKRVSAWLLVFLAVGAFTKNSRNLDNGEYFIAIFFKIIADFFTHLYLHRPSARDNRTAGEPSLT